MYHFIKCVKSKNFKFVLNLKFSLKFEMDFIQNRSVIHLNSSKALNPCFFRKMESLVPTFFSLDLFKFIFGGGISGLFFLVGLIGNILCIILLTQKAKNASSSITFLLRCLAIFDAIFLLCAVPFQVIPSFVNYFKIINKYYFDYFPYINTFVYFLGQSIRMTRNWIIVCITIERWFAIKYPLQAKIKFTVSTAAKIVRLLLLLCFSYNLPRFLEYFPDIVVEPCRNITYLKSGAKFQLHSNLFYNYFYQVGSYLVFVI